MAYELAISLDLPKAYDAQYIAAAQVEGVELITVDGGVRDVANRLGVPVRFLR